MKLHTDTPDTMTLDIEAPLFRVPKGRRLGAARTGKGDVHVDGHGDQG